MQEQNFREIFKLHSAHLQLKDVRQRPVLVVFSAPPGSGKSELTKRLVENYSYLRIANKDIRESINATGDLPEEIISTYTLWLLDKLARNKKPSIVFDRNIDQWYKPSKKWAADNGYRYVLVRISVSREIQEKRLLNREGDKKAKVFGVLDFYNEQHAKISELMKPDIELSDDYDLEEVAEAIARS